MSAGMPELGSKISLISKADIRYEGRLFTVDPKECTIALSSVRSFGTEDRETQYPLPAQTQVYDYILFRGSDIKDIRVINSSVPTAPVVPNDPAIMQMSMPPALGMGPPQGFQPPFQHPVLAPPMSSYQGGYVPMGGLGGRPMQSQPSEFVNSQPIGLDERPQRPPDLRHDLIGGGSRSTTPASLSSRKSPTADQGVQVSGMGKKDESKRMPGPIQPPGQRVQQRERKDSKGDGTRPDYRNQNQNRMSNTRGGPGGHQGHQYRGGQQGWNNRGQPRQPQQHHQQQQQYAPQQNRGPRRNQGGSGRPNQGQGQQQQQNAQGSRPKNTLKFENDYDFEQANTQFEELRTQFDKLKVKDGAKPAEVVNGDIEKKDDSGNETGAGECEQEDEEQTFYNKAKSFFDNISCEAVERSKGRTQRTDWRAERKLNSETFGVSSTRRNGYRGRGGYYNRGGYRQNFRGGYNRNQGQRRPQDNSNRPLQTNQEQAAQQQQQTPNAEPTAATTK